MENEGEPRVLGIFEKMFAPTNMVHHHTLKEFEKIVGKGKAKAALDRYYRRKSPRATKTRRHAA